MNKWKTCSHFVVRMSGFSFKILNCLKLKNTSALLKQDIFREKSIDCNRNELIKQSFEAEMAILFGNMDRILKENPDLKKAIHDSNREFFKNNMDKLNYAGLLSLNKKIRHSAKKLYLFLQRFVAKNDTIDFYGPSTYGQFQADREKNIHLLWTSIENRIIGSNFFTNRAIQTIGEAIANHPEVYMHVIPAINKAMIIKNNNALICKMPLQGDFDRQIFAQRRLSGVEMDILQLIKEQNSIETIIRQFEPVLAKERIIEILNQFKLDGLINFELPIPKHALYLLPYLQQYIQSMNESTYRNELLSSIDHLTVLRDRYFKEDDYRKKDELYNQLETVYKQLTNADAWIASGRFYEERFICFRESHKATREFYIGWNLKRDIDEKIPLVLDLLLVVPNWFYQEYFKILHDFALRNYYEGKTENLVDFIYKMNDDQDFLQAVNDLDTQLTQQCEALYQIIYEKSQKNYIKEGNSRIDQLSLSRNDILDILGRYPYKPEHAYVSLDFLIAAASVEAICRNKYELIIGEIHTNIRVLLAGVFFCNYHGQDMVLEDFNQCVKVLNGKDTIVADMIRQDSGRTIRNGDQFLGDIVCTGFSHKNKELQFEFSELTVHITERSVDLLDKNGKKIKVAFIVPNFLETTFMRAFSYPMWFGIAPYLKYPKEKYYPEVSFENIVISRRAFHLELNNMLKLFEGHRESRPFEDFVLLQTYFSENDYPHQFYAKFSSEPKVIYFDLDNYLAADLFKTLMFENSGQHVTITEMKPDQNELWLADEKGRYCNEFRTLFYY
jgi:hypothetical protein